MSGSAGAREKRYHRPNDDWSCTADDQSPCGGCGKHAGQETVCQPVPSLRMRRGIFVLVTTMLTGGLLICLFNSPSRNDWLSPGPLTSAHARILGSHGPRRCDACHGAGDRTLVDWMQDAIASGRHIPVSQSSLCMECHRNTLPESLALAPHNLEADELDRMTAAALRDIGGANRALHSDQQLACSTCHREHHGADFNLAALTDRQCQTCHVSYIHSFEKGHPEFRNWPEFSQRTIAFDHSSHAMLHFAEKNESFDCRLCHVDGPRGNVKQLVSYETGCARCHDHEIRGEASPEWTFLKLPMLDIDALAAAGKSPGSWPAGCSGDFDGDFPPAMKWLLASDPAVAEILARRGEKFDFGDLDAGVDQDLNDARILAWAIKGLVLDLASSGPESLRTRLENNFDDSMPGPTPEWHVLSSGLHADIFLNSMQAWFPNLRNELSAIPPASHDSPIAVLPSGQKILARPADRVFQETTVDTLLAENPLAALMSGKTVSETPGNFNAQGTSQATQPPPDNIAEENSASTAQQDSVDVDENDILVANPLAGEVAPPSIVGNPDNVAVQTPDQKPFAEIAREAFVAGNPGGYVPAASGWRRNDEAFSITYKPQSHQDPVMRGWIELATARFKTPAQWQNELFESLALTSSAGACARCHDIARTATASQAIRWAPLYRDPDIRGFTRFSHRPHDTLAGTLDCQSCHRVNKKPQERASPGVASGKLDFEPMSKTGCAECHREGGAPDGCVDCHSYHVGSRITGQ